MEITGKLIKKFDIESGISKAGKEWNKQSILIEQNAEYNKEVVISAFGDKIEKLKNLQEGDNLKVLCNIYSREYNGRYFHNIDGYWFAKAEDDVKEDNNDNMPF
tara:strand:+ start:127 stop:438 length:312 start_codon:yes stop_codon:yes gene_type:complete